MCSDAHGHLGRFRSVWWRVLVHDGTQSNIQASSREYYINANLELGINSVPMEELAILVKAQFTQRMGGHSVLNYKRERGPWIGVLGHIN